MNRILILITLGFLITGCSENKMEKKESEVIEISESEEQKALARLSFLVGNWKGQSTIYSKDSVKTAQVSERVKYLLDGNLLTLDVKSPFIQLHTVIRYSAKDSTYYYHPFTNTSEGKAYKGRIENGKFIVLFNDNYKVIFERTEDGKFHEYGERIVNGKKEMSFEDLLEPVSE